MPRTMQQSIVKNSAMNLEPFAIVMIAVMSCEARPVIAMLPAITPAIAQAIATEIELLPPPARASKNIFGVIRESLLKRLTMIAAMIAIAAENAIVLRPLETI